MEETLSLIRIFYKRYALSFWALVIALVLAIAGGILCRKSLHGHYMYMFAKWEEDAFVGKPVSELEQFLGRKNITLDNRMGDRYCYETGKTLKGNQRVMTFQKGQEFATIGYGVAVNLGLVVTEIGPKGEIVVEIIHIQEVD